MQQSRARKPTTSLRLPGDLLAEVDRLVDRTQMRSRTEFVERAIRAYLEELREAKVLAAKPWSLEKGKTAVVRYLARRPSAYVSEIAEALGMDFDLAFRVVDALLEAGRLDRAP